jgi:hypothetical protein
MDKDINVVSVEPTRPGNNRRDQPEAIAMAQKIVDLAPLPLATLKRFVTGHKCRKALPSWRPASQRISPPCVTARMPPKACAPSRNGVAAIQGVVRPLCVPDLGWAVSDFVGPFQGAGSAREFGTHEHRN